MDTRNEIISFTSLKPKQINNIDFLEDEAKAKNVLNSTKESFLTIKTELNSIIDTLKLDNSLFTRLVNFWTALSWSRKFFVSTLLIFVTLSLGFLPQIGLIAIAVISIGLLIYSNISRNKSIQNSIDRVKKGVTSMATILEEIINTNNTIFQNLITKLNQVIKKNMSLSTQLHDNLVSLEESRQKNEETVSLLHSELSESKTTLNTTILEFTNMQTMMTSELNKAQSMAAAFEGTVRFLSITVIGDTVQRENFQKKLDAFLCNADANFAFFSQKFVELAASLANVKDELHLTADKYQQLLHKQENQVSRLEKITFAPVEPHVITKKVPKNPTFFTRYQKNRIISSQTNSTENDSTQSDSNNLVAYK